MAKEIYMERINGIKHYSLDDIINILIVGNYGIKIKEESKVIQFLNGRTIPYSEGTEKLKLYSEDTLNDIMDYFYKNQKIKEYKNKIAELGEEIKELNNKYPVIKNIKRGKQ